MNPRIDDFKSRVQQVYPDVTQVDDSVLRFYKCTVDDVPYAVCYLDFADSLPTTELDLRSYVERVFGSHYFDEQRSLQWNHYLYFIRDAHTLQERVAGNARRMIEDNREYARKFVIDESGLDCILRPSNVQSNTGLRQIDVASKWADVLEQPHLIEAVFGQHSLADRMRLIDGTKAPAEQSDDPPRAEPQEHGLLPCIRKIEFSEYRPCLEDRMLQFSDVNLLFGANGSGKTSLLEAIELYYCGRTRRNPSIEENYRFKVETEEGTSTTVTSGRTEQEFRNRARAWFGVNEPRNRPSRLCDAFGRFSFLDTDAAIDLARNDNGSIEFDLARLLVGSEASVVWQIIERLADDVATDMRREEKRKSEVDLRLESAQKAITDYGKIKKESDSLHTALLEALRRNNWLPDDRERDNILGFLVEQMSEFRSVAQQILELKWLKSPVTLDVCQQYLSSVQEVIVAQQAEVEQFETLNAHQAQVESEKVQIEKVVALLTEIEPYIEARVERRHDELSEQRLVVSQTAEYLTGIDDQLLGVARSLPSDQLIAELEDASAHERARLDLSLRDAKDSLNTFTSVRDQSNALAQQLRRIAMDIIGDQPANECPLCHTRFAPGELAQSMAMGVDKHVEATAQKLLSNVSRLEKDLSEAESIERAVSLIGRFCVCIQLSKSVSVETALSRIAEYRTQLRDGRGRIDALISEEKALRASGLTHERMNQIHSKLELLGHTRRVQSQEDYATFRADVEKRRRALLEEILTVTKDKERIRAAVQPILNGFGAKADNLRKGLAELEGHYARTEAVYSRLIEFATQFGWSRSKPVAKWIVEAETVVNLAANFQTALGKERFDEDRYADLLQQKSEIELESKRIADRVTRLSDASKSFSKLQRDHSLTIVTQSAMETNRKTIEDIFSQIHSPAEFTRIEYCEGGWSVDRKRDDKRVRLTQISTGQRAAFALSVFLAQNAQLRAGPSVILIDDPIAHVDDLNCLSFLDYLRDVALMGTRQIFFATASDKLVSLFSRKFDFLGDKFKRVDIAL